MSKAEPVVDRRDTVREAFIRERGFWAPPFEAILQLDPDYLAAYLEFSAGPWRRGALDPPIKELMYIAADAAVTHLHGGGTAAHIGYALRRGASPAQIASVLELASLLGLQTLELGIPLVLAEVRASTGAQSEQVEEESWLAGLAALDPDGAAAAQAWLDAARIASALEPKVVELVGVAVNASTTHLNAAATQRHIRAALAAGATPMEIVEVLEIVSVLGIHTATMAVPLLLEETGAAGSVQQPSGM